MFCKFCGEKIEDGSLFCANCGSKLNTVEKETEAFGDEETNIVVNEKIQKNIPEQYLPIIQKCCFWGLIAGIVGVAILLGTIVYELIEYGRIYLLVGHDFTIVLTYISIVLMIIGFLSIIMKGVLIFVFKKEELPKEMLKRVLLIVLAVTCLAGSILGFSSFAFPYGDFPYGDDYYDSDVGSGTSGSYNDTVSARIGLSLSVTKMETSSNYTYVYCTVKNISGQYGNPTCYRYVKVKAVFMGRYGVMIDTDWTYAVDSVWLNPGETKTFDYMVRNTSIQSVDLSIIE